MKDSSWMVCDVLLAVEILFCRHEVDRCEFDGLPELIEVPTRLKDRRAVLLADPLAL